MLKAPVLEPAQQLRDEARSLPEVAAAMGELESAPIEFQATCDVAQGGVLLALPTLWRRDCCV